MTQLRFSGGARIGTANVTWPFARLKVSNDRIELNASIFGNLVFRPEDIISIESYSGIMSVGLKINHRVPEYKENVIFWTSKNPSKIIQKIRQTGFLDNPSETTNHTDSNIIADRRKQDGFPLKKNFSITAIVIWNILLITDFLRFAAGNSYGIMGYGSLTALGLVFLTCLLLLVSKGFRKIALKEDRGLKDIVRFLLFIMFISGFMFFNLFMAFVF